MKRLFKFFTLVACITFLAATAADAQNQVRNATSCTVILKIEYGLIGSCTAVGTVVMTVPAGTQVPIPILDFYAPLRAKGGYANLGGALAGCPFYIAELCAGGPTVDNVTCNSLCGNYTASMITNFGIYLN